MGTLSYELPDGTRHSWRCDSAEQVAAFLEHFRQRMLRRIRTDPEIAQQWVSKVPEDAALIGYVYGMLQHVLTTPGVPAVKEWRQQFLTWWLLTQEIPDDSQPGCYGDYLPNNDIEMRLAVLPEGIEVLGRMTPAPAPAPAPATVLVRGRFTKLAQELAAELAAKSQRH